MNETYVPARVAKKIIGVHGDSLRVWANQGRIPYIRTPGGDRRYNISEFLEQLRESPENETDKEGDLERTKVCYCRVSSAGQKDDLERQVEYMRSLYPDHRIITDVGSGINFKRRGLRTLLDLACKGSVSEVVVAYRDRLCRFAFELLQWIFDLHSVKVVVLNESVVSKGSEAELVEDLLAIVNVYACRVNGKRKYAKRKKIEETEASREPVEEDPAVPEQGTETCV